MKQTLLLVPTGIGVGLSTVILGLSRVFEEQGVRVKRFRPVNQSKLLGNDAFSISVQEAEKLLSNGQSDQLLEKILTNFHTVQEQADVVLVYGLIMLQEQSYAADLNIRLAATLNAQVIIVTTPANYSLIELDHQIEIAARYFGGIDSERMFGCIINKINGPVIKGKDTRLDLGYWYEPNAAQMHTTIDYQQAPVFQKDSFKLLGCIPWNPEIIAPRVQDVAAFLEAKIINPGAMHERFVHYITLCARSINNMTDSLVSGTLIITPGDRSDVIVATCMAALNGVSLAGVLLTGGFEPDAHIMNLCQRAFEQGLPLLAVPENSFRAVVMLHDLTLEIPADDGVRLERIKYFVASHLKKNWIRNFITATYERHLSPVAFRYQLTKRAQAAKKKIVLPEGAEARTLAAAALCAERGIAHCILLAEEEEVRRTAQNNGIVLPADITILNPTEIAERFVEPLLTLRKDKGLTEFAAKEYLQDPVVVGTMMLQQGEVDGLVSGAVHTTANTIRPALQIIKSRPDVKLISSVFFMCMPEQVLLFADCAVIPDPDVTELAHIAIQTAETACAFGITPRIAMISYSTGSSGSGQDVDKVRAATELVKTLRPDLVIDGPLQYDSALIPSVAQSKAPDSPVAGKATVFIFPNLNTGNTTYKAVQRSADVVCIGPMLQGLRKPVNDLSRGASIEDILYTIAITAIQAESVQTSA